MINNSNFYLTDKQQDIVNQAVNWYHNSSAQIFQIAGNPGTGKSVVLNAIVESLKLKPSEVAPMAYVGAAAINMRTKGMISAKTIHSWIYERREKPLRDKHGNIIMDPLTNRPRMHVTMHRKTALPGIKLIIVDEGGMVPENIARDILRYNLKVLVAGDLDQLPPIEGRPGFLIHPPIHVLDEILRQAKDSDIIIASQYAKNGLPLHCGLSPNHDVFVIERHELQPEMLLNANMILCGYNNTKDYYTTLIRNKILGIYNTFPIAGEKVVCKKNSWDKEVDGISLTNGLTGHCLNSPDQSVYDGKTFAMDFYVDKCNGVFSGLKVDGKYFTSDYKNKRYLKENNFLEGECMDFAYLMTIHSAQGSQWDNGIIFEEHFSENNNKLLYTAITRFRKKVIIVKQDRKYW